MNIYFKLISNIGLMSAKQLLFIAVLMGIVRADSIPLELHKSDAPLSTANPSALTNSANAPVTASKAIVQSSGPNGGQVVNLTSTSGTNSVATPVVVTVSGQQFGLKPNPVGIYPRLTIPAKAVVGIHLNVTSNNQIEVMVLDGGTIGIKDRSSVQLADASGNIDFTFSAPANPGNHRIAFLTNGKKQILKFWIGPDLPTKVVSSNK